MANHSLKCWPEYFVPILDGLKTFEVRVNDRDYKVGDNLTLQEWVPGPDYDEDGSGSYTGRECSVFVPYILSGPGFNIRDGMVIMSITRWRI